MNEVEIRPGIKIPIIEKEKLKDVEQEVEKLISETEKDKNDSKH